VQPYHCSRPEVHYLDPYLKFLPKERYQDCFPWQDLRESGAHLSFGSDWPVVSMNPFFGFDAAVNRQAWRPGLASQAQTLSNTLFAYSKDAAYTEFAEAEKGQLKVGMLADLVLLSEDVFATPADKLKDLTALLTICDGQVVFER
jgi:predicted amidohydrolase YtcJ